MTTQTVAALQIGSHADASARRLEHILSFESEIRASGAALVVMPEALIGGYRMTRTWPSMLACELRKRGGNYFMLNSCRPACDCSAYRSRGRSS